MVEHLLKVVYLDFQPFVLLIRALHLLLQLANLVLQSNVLEPNLFVLLHVQIYHHIDLRLLSSFYVIQPLLEGFQASLL